MALIYPSYETGLFSLPSDDFGEGVVPFVKIGSGPIPLVVVPGVGDGLTLVTEAARRLAWYYRHRAKSHRLLVLSRRAPLPVAYGVERHAQDMTRAALSLGWEAAVWEVISAAGPVGLYAAVQHPEAVKGLVLSSSMHRTHLHTRQVLEDWITLAEAGEWEAFHWSTVVRTMRPQTIARAKRTRTFAARFTHPPQEPQRVIRLLQGLLDLDLRSILPDIQAPCLVIGGQEDRVIPAEIQREMSALITNSRLKLFPGFGHGNDQENPEYNLEVEKYIHRILSTG